MSERSGGVDPLGCKGHQTALKATEMRLINVLTNMLNLDLNLVPLSDPAVNQVIWVVKCNHN